MPENQTAERIQSSTLIYNCSTREKQSPPPPTLIRPQDLETAARPEFIDDIVRELTEGE